MIAPIVLTIAGSDSSGGAGIQADLKTIAANGCYGASVITMVTAQNTQGVQGMLEIPDFSIKEQFAAVMSDMDVACIKIGMLQGVEMIETISALLEDVNIPIVLDPIIATSDKTELLQKEAINCMKEQLFSKVFLLTPNIPEAEILADMKIENIEDMKTACKVINAENILLKGGHMQGNILVDVLYHDGEFHEFKHRKIKSQNTHGTGCTLSSAIASNLALGMDMPLSCETATSYVAKAILASYPTGKGQGSLNHCFMVNKDA